MERDFDARAWAIWLAATAALALLTRNPLYLLLLLLAALLVRAALPAPDRLPFPLRRFAVVILLFSTLFNLLYVRIGATVLLRLPADWWLIGGPLTLEAAVYGIVNGLILLTLLAVFLAFQSAVAVSDLISLAPRALVDVGMVLLIAMTYAPQTVQQMQRIRAAQAIRGHRLRGLRDWRPIVIPLLVGGLERAMSLAEAMAARGYGRLDAPTPAAARLPLRVQALLLVGLLAAFAGWLATYWIGWPGWLLLGAGGGLLVALYWQRGRQVQTTRYRPRAWTRRDTLLTATAVAPLLLALVPLPLIDRASLTYSPYPALSLPRFDPLLGVALALLALPALMHSDTHALLKP
jgi:energy-coupling factor transport system permease protein